MTQIYKINKIIQKFQKHTSRPSSFLVIEKNNKQMNESVFDNYFYFILF